MKSDTREGRLAAAFGTLADTLVVGYDVVELLQRLGRVSAPPAREHARGDDRGLRDVTEHVVSRGLRF